MRQEQENHMPGHVAGNCSIDELVGVSEMAIVDTFTKLIFSEQDNYQPLELLIIAAFRSVDTTVLRDTYEEMGAYLRNLGVREMIELVGAVREYLQDTKNTVTNTLGEAVMSQADTGVLQFGGAPQEPTY